MSVFCGMGIHRAAAQPVWNNGFYFSACTRCGCDLVRGAHDRWRAVPRGFKVVWRQRPPGYPDWSNLEPEQAPTRILPRPAAIGGKTAGLSSMLGRN
jgi:hypothetical protein